MRLRFVLAIVGVVAGGCKSRTTRGTGDAAIPMAATPPASKPAHGEHPLATAHRATLEARAVDVDRRFALALADVARLTGQPTCTVTRHVATTSFKCPAGTRDVSELADFEALHEVLELAASGATLEAGPAPDESNTWIADSVARGLVRARSAGQSWVKSRSRAAALDGLHGVLSTLLAEHDDFGLSDSISARALALLALAERGGPRPLEAALLAHVLGYEAAGARLATALPGRDPVRDYLTQPLSTAARVEATASPSPLALYLAHRALLEAGEATRAAALRARMSAPLAALTAVHVARLVSPRYREPLALATLLPWEGLRDARELAGMAEDARGPRVETEADVAALVRVNRETLLGPLAEAVTAIDKSGAFLEGGLVEDHFRALVAASDDAYRVAQMQTLENVELEDAVRASEPKVRPSSYAGGVNWLRLATSYRGRQISQSTMTEYLASPTTLFGADPLIPVLAAFWEQQQWRAPVQRQVDAEIHRRADGRPSNRPLLAKVAWHFYDFVRYDELGRSWQSVAGTHGSTLSALITICDGRAAQVRALLADAHAPAAERRAAFDALELADLVAPVDRKAMASLLVADGPGPYEVARAARLLETVDPRRAERLCTDWLTAHPDERQSRGGAEVETALASLQLARKDLVAAEATITEALAHGEDLAFYRAALVHLAKKDAAGAEALVRARASTHAEPTSIAYATEILVRNKSYAAAAQLLANPPVPLGLQPIIDVISPIVVKALSDEASVTAFVGELKRAGFNLTYLPNFGDAFGRIGREDLAFQIASLAPAEGFAAVERCALAYPHLAAAKGTQVADAWVKQNLPAPLFTPFAIFAQAKGQIDPLFTLVPDPTGTDELSDLIWATRLTALVQHHEGSGPRWARVEAHYTANKVGSEHDVMGRYILGLEPFEAADELVEDGDAATEVSFYLAIGALTKGHMADANDWLQTALRSGAFEKREWTQSLDMERSFAKARRAPALLAKAWTLHP